MRNFRTPFVFPTIKAFSSANVLYFRESMIQEEVYTDERLKQAFKMSPFRMNCSLFQGEGKPMCFSLSLQSSRFSYFNYKMNPRNTPVMVNPALGMQFQGKILNLKGFAGPVTINQTLFEQNTLAYHTCDGWADVESDT